VIASARRLMEFLQFCSRRSRTAEMKVPAWPIPIHQTKLVMAKAQATGMLFPQVPIPVSAVYSSVEKKKSAPKPVTRNESFQKGPPRQSGRSSRSVRWASLALEIKIGRAHV